MTATLKQLWGVAEPVRAPTRDAEAGRAHAAYAQALAELNGNLQQALAVAEPGPHQALRRRRDALYDAYRELLAGGGAPGDAGLDGLLDAARQLAVDARALQRASEAARAAWGAREGDHARALARVESLEDADAPSAGPLRAAVDGVRTALAQRRYAHACRLLDALLQRLDLPPAPAAAGGAAPAAAGLAAFEASKSAPAPGPTPGPTIGARAGFDHEPVTLELGRHATRYGDLKLSVTTKVIALVGPSGDDADFTGSVTSKDKGGARTIGTKKTFALRDYADRELFAGLAVEDIAIAAECEIDGSDVNVSGQLRFTIATRSFKVPAQAKLTLLSIKGGKEVAGPAIEIKVAPLRLQRTFGDARVELRVEYKAGFSVDLKKVGTEVGRKLVEEAAVELLKREAKKQGVKVLGREAAARLVNRLSPLAAAFAVGWEVGQLLNAYTSAPEVAREMHEAILGNFAKRYHEADTLGRMRLVAKNLHRIAESMVAAGLVGAAHGVTDVIVFGLLGLDRAADYAEALADLRAGVSVGARALREAVHQGFGGAMLYGVLMLGIKTNPKRVRLGHVGLEPLFAAIHRRLQPLYRRRGGFDRILVMRVSDAGLAAAALMPFAQHAHGAGLGFQDRIDLASPAAVAASLQTLAVVDLLLYLELHRLVSYTFAMPQELDPDAIDGALVDELFE